MAVHLARFCTKCKDPHNANTMQALQAAARAGSTVQAVQAVQAVQDSMGCQIELRSSPSCPTHMSSLPLASCDLFQWVGSPCSTASTEQYRPVQTVQAPYELPHGSTSIAHLCHHSTREYRKIHTLQPSYILLCSLLKCYLFREYGN